MSIYLLTLRYFGLISRENMGGSTLTYSRKVIFAAFPIKTKISGNFCGSFNRIDRLTSFIVMQTDELFRTWVLGGSILCNLCALKRFQYRSADKSLARPDRKKIQLKCRRFSSDAEVTAAAQTWLDGQLSELFSSGLQKLEFGRCSLLPSWSV